MTPFIAGALNAIALAVIAPSINFLDWRWWVASAINLVAAGLLWSQR